MPNPDAMNARFISREDMANLPIRRFDGDRFVDGYFEEDDIGLLQQLGALKEPASADRGRHSPLADVAGR